MKTSPSGCWAPILTQQLVRTTTRLRTTEQIKELIAKYKIYAKLNKEHRSGQSSLSEAEVREMHDLALEVKVGMTKLRLAEQRGRAEFLSQQVGNTARFGIDLDKFAPPVETSRLEFKSTRLLNKMHKVLADPNTRASTELASLIVFRTKGLLINRMIEYPIDKFDQLVVLKKKEKIDNYNAKVALDRSRDFQRRHYADESTDRMLNWLSQAMSSMGEGSGRQ